jgi:hypothetical protein
MDSDNKADPPKTRTMRLAVEALHSLSQELGRASQAELERFDRKQRRRERFWKFVTFWKRK